MLPHEPEIDVSDQTPPAQARLATRLAFFAAGFAIAAWAPLIPFAKANVGADEALLGLLLLCLGLGSIIAMPVTGWVTAQKGARGMILLGGYGLALVLPLLALAGSVAVLAALLFVFGAVLGTIDVAMNVHAAEVERREGRPLMSGFHAQFSLGGFAGAGLMTALLTLGLAPGGAAALAGGLTLAAMVVCHPRLMRRAKVAEPEPFAMPRGIVVLLAALAAIMFLVEGAVMDWGALLLIERALAEPSGAGLGFMLFSLAMVVGRLTGDVVVARLGGVRILVGGGLLTLAGVAVILLAPVPVLALSGFALVGLGASNLVPVVFSAAGRQQVMPAGPAIAVVTTVGYAGILLGPALIGFAADVVSLPVAFWLLGVLILAVPLTARRVAG
ncbi:MAG: MFS transporter [Rhodobacteraceae bacterium]|nr:MAG: MFS transporter [Paracoccaceae bacterium]